MAYKIRYGYTDVSGNYRTGGDCMPKDEVLAALEDPNNDAIEVLLGAVLRPRLDQEGWEDIIILQHLDQGGPNLTAWNDLFTRVLAALADPTILVEKAKQSLNGVAVSRFNDALDDLVAELLAAIYLAESGHKGISFVSEGGPVTADIESEFQDSPCFTEVKNLRDPRSLSIVAFKRWCLKFIGTTSAFTQWSQNRILT